MMNNQEKEIDDDYSQVDITLDAVEEGEGVVDSINPGKGLRKIGFGVVIKMVGGGGRKFKIGKGGLTDAMVSGGGHSGGGVCVFQVVLSVLCLFQRTQTLLPQLEWMHCAHIFFLLPSSFFFFFIVWQLSGIKEKNYSNLPKVGTRVKYKYCALNR